MRRGHCHREHFRDGDPKLQPCRTMRSRVQLCRQGRSRWQEGNGECDQRMPFEPHRAPGRAGGGPGACAGPAAKRMAREVTECMPGNHNRVKEELLYQKGQLGF